MTESTFKLAAELGVTEVERDALIQVLHGLESGKLRDIPVEEAFYMPNVLKMDCGTKGCLLGWAYLISDRKAFDGPGLRAAENGNPFKCGPEFEDRPALDELFFPDSYEEEMDLSAIEPKHAVAALRNFLTHGEPRWLEALSQ